MITEGGTLSHFSPPSHPVLRLASTLITGSDMSRNGGAAERYEEDEEEALSLCDLPLKYSNEDSGEKPVREIQMEDEFDFCSFGGSALGILPQMCAADELFYRGQILPLRLSVSSENSSSHRHLSRNASGSDSTDDICGSSLGSSNSTMASRPRAVQNVFHSYPSPKPQIRASTSRQGSFNGRTQKSSTWDFLRLGLVRTPGLELQDLKIRTSSHNKASVANNGGSVHSGNRPKTDKRTGLFGGVSCKFSVQTVPPKMMTKINDSWNKRSNDNESAAHAIRGKVLLEMKTKKQNQLTQKKQALSHHRTFEWLKDLSHPSFSDDS